MEVDDMHAIQESAATIASAVVVVGRDHAVIARQEHGEPLLTEIDRRSDPEELYLLRIARAARHCERLVVLGQGSTRLAFEREYVSLYRRPDRLVAA